MKKYENKNNVIGNLIKEYRTNANLSKTEVSRQLQLHAVYIDRTELNRMEEGRMIIKDFELIALFIHQKSTGKIRTISKLEIKNHNGPASCSPPARVKMVIIGVE